MSRKKTIAKLVSMIVAGAYSLSANGASAAAGPPDGDRSKFPDITSNDVWSTIERINRDNPTAAMRIQIAQVAGQSELAAAIVQSVSGCTGAAADCVKQAIAEVGGLTTRNLVSLAELTAALEAVGIPPAIVAAALDAYSTEVAAAVVAGVIPEQFAATTLAEEAAGSLYE
jgi:hypothetical protein